MQKNRLAFTIVPAMPQDVSELTGIIRHSFQNVAKTFGLTSENCPRHPSNCRPEWIETALNKGVRYYMLESEGKRCGCVALEQARPTLCYLERLAVLPDCRRRGYGGALVEFALNTARQLGAEKVDIGIIARQEELKDWYQRLGFMPGKNSDFCPSPI